MTDQKIPELRIGMWDGLWCVVATDRLGWVQLGTGNPFSDHDVADWTPLAALPTPPAEASKADALRTELHAIYVAYLDRYCTRRINHRHGDFTPEQLHKWETEAHARFVETYPAVHAFRFPGEATDG